MVVRSRTKKFRAGCGYPTPSSIVAVDLLLKTLGVISSKETRSSCGSVCVYSKSVYPSFSGYGGLALAQVLRSSG